MWIVASKVLHLLLFYTFCLSYMLIVSTVFVCKVVEYVNVLLGVFLCPLCAHTHKFLEWPFKDVRPLFSTNWEQIELEV